MFLEPFRANLHPDIAALEPLWRRAELTGHATPFQNFDWLQSLISNVARPRGIETFALEVLDATGRSIMLLPLLRRRRSGLRVISIIDFEVCDYLAPVLFPGPDLPLGSSDALSKAIRAALPESDVFRVAKMPRCILGRNNPLLHVNGVREMPMRQFGLALTPPATDLIRRITRASTYRDLAKFRRRLEKRGKVEFRLASSPSEVDSIANVMFAQRRARFQEIGRENLLDAPDIELFFRDAAQRGLRGGPLRIFGLSVDDEWVATACGLVSNTTFALVAQTMASGAWRNCSPGIVVTASTMEWSVDAGITYFDFTIGYQPYKLELGASEGKLYELYLPTSARGVAASAARLLIRAGKDLVRRNSRLDNAMRGLRDRIGTGVFC